MKNLEVEVTIVINYAYPHRDYEARVERTVKVEASYDALRHVPFESLCQGLAQELLVEFMDRGEERDGS